MGLLGGGLLNSGGTSSGGGGLSSVVGDTSPELGGNLNCGGFDFTNLTDITFGAGINPQIWSSNDIDFSPNSGTSEIRLGGSFLAPNNATSMALGKAGLSNVNARWTSIFLKDHMSLKSASDTSTETDCSHIYSKDVSTISEVFVRDEGGTVTQISEHSRQAPDSLYDDEDDIIDRMGFEIQYFQGFVRFTNKTRIGLLASMTDAEKSALTSEQRQCVYQESFADYNTRTGENLVQLDWDTEQTRLQSEYDALVEEGEVEAKDIKKAKPSWLV